MKKGIKTVLLILLILVVLTAGSIVVLRFGFGYDVFDRSGWSVCADGELRYLTYEGDPLLGWQEIDGATYYFVPERDGAIATGWMDVADGRYYFDGDGRIRTGWLDTTDGRYYLGYDGVCVSGWIEIENDRYFFDENGAMVTGWLPGKEGIYYLNEQGHMVTGWVDVDGCRYYLDGNGLLCSGWREIGGCRYYFGDGGAMVTGWLDTAEGRYYLSESGAMATGWQNVGDKQYYLTESGVAWTGWMETEDALYYFHEDGAMAVGEVEIDGTARYFTSTGKYFVLVNPWNPVPEDYEPNLVEFGGFKVDAVCREALDEMIEACNAAGYSCGVTSAYRSYDRQVYLFERKVTKLMGQGYSREAAEKETALSIAIPGTSEHQLGLAVDMKSSSDTYAWLAEHSWEYGFILRYPYGKTDLTGIYYEPWHFRYVGDELAKELYDLGLCVEEYMNMLTELTKSET